MKPVLVTDFGEINLPDHEQAVKNLDLSNPRLAFKGKKYSTAWYDEVRKTYGPNTYTVEPIWQRLEFGKLD